MLGELERARAQLHTARIDWSAWKPRFGDRYHFYTTRIAGDDLAIDQRGDDEGVLGRRSDGTSNPASAKVHRTLRADGQVWQYPEPSPGASVYPISPRTPSSLPDLRALGALYGFSQRDIHDTLWFDGVSQAGPRRYSEESSDGLRVVHAETDYGEITWWIDPQQGNMAVRVTLSRDGQVVQEARSTLKEFDGVWFPEHVAFFRSNYKDGKEPCEIVRIHAASFNEPDHPARLTPADIGIEVGHNIEMHDNDGQYTALLKWDGEKPVTLDEYSRRWRAGELKTGPNLQRLYAQLKAAEERRRAEGDPKLLAHDARNAGATVSRVQEGIIESEWEAYTRQFIDEYRLNEDQSQKALDILKDCQDQANRYLGRHKAKFEKLDKQREAAAVATGDDAAKRRESLAAEQKRMREPIDAIFEKQLKPRLDKLPTRAQRRVAGEAERAKKADKP